MSSSKIFRYLFVVLGFIIGLMGPFISSSNFNDSSIFLKTLFVLAPLVTMPLALLFIVGERSINPVSSKVLKSSSENSNSTILQDPLHFSQVLISLFAAVGVGLLISSYLIESGMIVEALSMLSSSLGMLIGVKLCLKKYTKKYTGSEN